MALLPPTPGGRRGGDSSRSFPARCWGRRHRSFSDTRPAGRTRWGGHAKRRTGPAGLFLRGFALIGAVRDVPLAPSSNEAVTAESRACALLRRGRRSSSRQICSGARGGEDPASVHFSLLTRWQPLNEQTTRKQIWSSPRLRWPDLVC